jgi:alpha-N-acetylglucosaminidase
VTLWGEGANYPGAGGPGNIHDYASKQWGGLVSSYYIPRWKLFLTELGRCLATKQDFNSSAFLTKQLLPFEINWQHNNASLPSQGTGQGVAQAKRVMAKYFGSGLISS